MQPAYRFMIGAWAIANPPYVVSSVRGAPPCRHSPLMPSFADGRAS
jgi:hypothetical protein